MTLEIAKMLILSTSHVTNETRLKMEQWAEGEADENGFIPTVYRKGDYGWIIHVHEAESEMDTDRFPEDVTAAIVFARGQGCQWIMYDCDADEIDELPTYEW
jgi:hypothetical protein